MVLNVTTLSHRGFVLMLFFIYACYLPISISGTNFFQGGDVLVVCRELIVFFLRKLKSDSSLEGKVGDG